VSLFTAWVICYPLDLIKTQIQAVNLMEPRMQLPTTNLVYHFKSRFRSLGLRGFYNGLGISLIRTVPTGGFSFLAYELMKERIEKRA